MKRKIKSERQAISSYLWLPAFLLIWIDPAIILLLWNWFAAPLGAHHINYGYAFGLVILLRFGINPQQAVAMPRRKWPDEPKEVWPFMVQAYTARIVPLVAGAVMYVILLHSK